MGRYGEYAPHTVEYQIYRGEATHSSGIASVVKTIRMEDYDKLRHWRFFIA